MVKLSIIISASLPVMICSYYSMPLNSVLVLNNHVPLISFGLYVHIPFCRQLLRFCNAPIGKNSFSSSGFEKMNREYTDALLSELSMISASSCNKIPLRSIYVGAGTLSLAPLATLETIMEAVCRSA